MKSMTGYGHGEVTRNEFSLSVELKSYNNRFLDLYVNLPPQVATFEPELRSYLAERCARGKVELQVRIRDLAASLAVTVDRELAGSYLTTIRALAENLGLDAAPSLDTLLSLDGVLGTERSRDPELYRGALFEALATAFSSFEAARVREGKATEADILANIATLRASLCDVEAAVPQIERNIVEGLRARFREVLGDQVDENRVLAETAVLLMKYTIGEEVSRLGAHLDAFVAEVAANPTPGKKLDFLCQEMNREVNTIGSKSPSLEIGRAVVTMKDALEKVREQLRNVE